MADRTARDRMARWREARAGQEGRSLTVWLKVGTAEQLKDLVERTGETQPAVVARAIEVYHSTVTCHGMEEPAIVTCHYLAGIKRRLGGSPTSRELKAEIIAFIKDQVEAGMTLRKITALLNEAGLPTLSGRGKWTYGTVAHLAKA